MSELKKYALHGNGFSGTTDDLEYAQSVLEKNGNGKIYISLDLIAENAWQIRLRDGRTIYCDDDNRWFVSGIPNYCESLAELLQMMDEYARAAPAIEAMRRYDQDRENLRLIQRKSKV